VRRLLQQLFGEESAEGTANEAATTSPLRTQPQSDTQPSEEEAASDGDRTYSLGTQLQNTVQMSGVEFEHYMAQVFEVLGYDVTILGGAGDQGVDLLLRKGHARIAVQCKNYRQPVGNKPVQEVFAGVKNYGIRQAWVVAPAGFTRGALDLAQSPRPLRAVEV
jgi:HJR/Mrr/RecB family endonuclease